MSAPCLLGHKTGPGRFHLNIMDDLGAPQMLALDFHPFGLHRPGMGKGIPRNHGHRIGVTAIGIIPFTGRSAGRVVVVDIGDVGVVDHRLVANVRDINVGEIAPAHPVGRHVDIARSERRPADRATAQGNADAQVMAADEQDQRRGIDRPPFPRPGNPTPAMPHPSPTTIMKGRKSPGRVIHPVPTPRVNPGPVAAAVWRPVDRDMGRIPDRAIAWLIAPGAVLIKVGIADHLFGNIATRRGIPVTVNPGNTPIVEVIRPRQITDAVLAQRGIAEAVGLTRIHSHAGIIVTINHAAPGKNRHPG